MSIILYYHYKLKTFTTNYLNNGDFAIFMYIKFLHRLALASLTRFPDT